MISREIAINNDIKEFGMLYTRYPIVARAQPLGRVRRASKGILHTIWYALLLDEYYHGFSDHMNFQNHEKLRYISFWGT